MKYNGHSEGQLSCVNYQFKLVSVIKMCLKTVTFPSLGDCRRNKFPAYILTHRLCVREVYVQTHIRTHT